MGWTGQTRQLMWTGQKYLPVRVKMTSLNEEDYLSLLVSPLSLPFLSLHTAMFYNERQISKIKKKRPLQQITTPYRP